ncbi:MAG: hypothetical protein K2X90_02225 [Candidatus Babeliaceae bacterium]|nr:hypothetical protein [Candidatus Babeliaceae bacterium]
MSYSWLTLLPPLIVIVVTSITRNVLLSLTGGILAAAAIAADFDFSSTLYLALQRILEETHLTSIYTGKSLDHLYIFSFLILLGILIQLMNHSGGIRAYTDFLLRFIKTPQAAQQTSLILSSTLFIDDYLNNLTVGAIMRPVTDHFTLARAKLAFLIDSMSGPLCLLIPASSWVAFILAQLQASGITQGDRIGTYLNEDPLFVYIACMPFLLYPLLMVCIAWATVYFGLSYGAMARFENVAKETGNLFGGNKPLHQAHQSEQFKGTLLDFILPISTFIGSFILALLYSGNSVLLAGTASFMQALSQADPFWSLFIASFIAVCLTIFLFIYHNPNHKQYVISAFVQGFLFMKNSLLVLLLAWTLSTLLKNDLQTGTYLASLLPADLSVSYLPFIIFVLCTIISASTGSVWGTIALMLPIALPLYYTITLGLSTVLLFPLLGALFSGSIAGSHFSPISDAMVMASVSAGCYHLDHVRTQMSYALNALIGSLAGFLIMSVLPATVSYNLLIGISLFTGFIVTLSVLFARAALSKKH